MSSKDDTMSNILKLREVMSAGGLVIALGLAGCSASGVETPDNNESHRTVSVEPQPPIKEPFIKPEYDVLSTPVYFNGGASFVITNGELDFNVKLRCEDGNLAESDPTYPSVEPIVYLGSIVCEDNKVSKSDWSDVLSQLQLGEAVK